MMQLSTNQLVSETRKAALGKGASFGVADDIARAVGLLAHYDIVPADELVAYLGAPLEGLPSVPVIDDDVLSVSGALGLCDVMAALDFMGACGAQEISLSGLLYPRLSLGLMALRQSVVSGSFVTMAQAHDISSLFAKGAHDVHLRLAPFREVIMPAAPPRIEIASAAYEALKLAAFETYVPSSAQSRQAGAGAGLNDND